MYKKEKYGYTLIELLVVMTVVALLSGISIFALQGARRSARDAQRKGDLEAIRSALELYKSDCGSYPAGGPDDFNTLFGTGGFDASEGGCGGSSSKDYLTNVPSDPQGSPNMYYYVRGSTGYTYNLCAKLEEPPTTPQSCTGYSDSNYKVTNP